jgi:predicted DNA-binding transcriptional regulator AlpA
MQDKCLFPTNWLAKRLGLSVSTIERLRANTPAELPPHITIGGSIRYDSETVERWLQERMRTPVIQTGDAGPAQGAPAH